MGVESERQISPLANDTIKRLGPCEISLTAVEALRMLAAERGKCFARTDIMFFIE